MKFVFPDNSTSNCQPIKTAMSRARSKNNCTSFLLRSRLESPAYLVPPKPRANRFMFVTQVMAVGPGEGLEFIKLDFSCPPEKHRRLDVVLHKLSDDIMFR